MVKTGVFKKIAALTAAIATIGAFAVSASAVTVSTTTRYEGEKVNVIANVAGVGGAVEVTYYATNGDEVVYVDQTTASSDGAATFDYVTDATDLNSAVKVGYTAATAATDATIPGYEISGDGITTVVVPTENIDGTQVLDYALAEGKKVTGVSAEDATVTVTFVSYADGKLTVTLAGATGDVKLNVETANAEVTPEPDVAHIGSAGIVSKGDNDEYTYDGDDEIDVSAESGNRKVSVLAKMLNVGSDYGIIISDKEITEQKDLEAKPEEGAYAAKGRNTEGQFAVQLIDNSEDGTWFAKGNTYYTGLYYLNPISGKYEVIPGGVFTIE